MVMAELKDAAPRESAQPQTDAPATASAPTLDLTYRRIIWRLLPFLMLCDMFSLFPRLHVDSPSPLISLEQQARRRSRVLAPL